MSIPVRFPGSSTYIITITLLLLTYNLSYLTSWLYITNENMLDQKLYHRSNARAETNSPTARLPPTPTFIAATAISAKTPQGILYLIPNYLELSPQHRTESSTKPMKLRTQYPPFA